MARKKKAVVKAEENPAEAEKAVEKQAEEKMAAVEETPLKAEKPKKKKGRARKAAPKKAPAKKSPEQSEERLRTPVSKEKKAAKPKKSKAMQPLSVKEAKQAPSVKEEPIPELKRVQPEINIGMIGHVDHGKTTLVSKLTGKWTDTHSEEIKRGITIRLGYANTVFYKCPKCEGFRAYTSSAVCPKCKSGCIPLRRVSFVDAPGHETLMATMLSGSAIMDCAILLIAANEPCPQPQTKEHLMALEMGDVKNIIIVQNKIDLVSAEDAEKNYQQIKGFTKGTFAENAPVIPMVAQQGINVDMLIYAIEELFKTPERDQTKDPLMFVARSFDINKPGTKPEKITGGILGGALKEGMLKKGQKIEIRPGRKKEKEGRMQWIPITTEIVSIRTGDSNIDEATPGGSIALMTMLDPSLVKSDALAGNVVGLPGKLPDTLYEIDLMPRLLERVVGAEKEIAVEPIKKGEALMLNVNSSVTTGVVNAISKECVHIVLKRPVCARKTNKITISRLLGHRFRLIGYGLIK